jgi:hypothetical protein
MDGAIDSVFKKMNSAIMIISSRVTFRLSEKAYFEY